MSTEIFPTQVKMTQALLVPKIFFTLVVRTPPDLNHGSSFSILRSKIIDDWYNKHEKKTLDDSSNSEK